MTPVADPIPATLAPLVGPLVNHAEPRTWQSDAVEAVRVDVRAPGSWGRPVTGHALVLRL